jgi:hypothetical protein
MDVKQTACIACSWQPAVQRTTPVREPSAPGGAVPDAGNDAAAAARPGIDTLSPHCFPFVFPFVAPLLCFRAVRWVGESFAV